MAVCFNAASVTLDMKLLIPRFMELKPDWIGGGACGCGDGRSEANVTILAAPPEPFDFAK